MSDQTPTTDLLTRMQAEAETWSAEEPERALWIEAKAEIERLRGLLQATKTPQIRRLRAALAYYAAPDHWEYGEVPGHVYVHDDAGTLARRSLGLPSPIPADERFEIELECRRIMDEEVANG